MKIINETKFIGCTPLANGVYLHVSDAKVAEVLVVGVARADMQDANLLWVF